LPCDGRTIKRWRRSALRARDSLDVDRPAATNGSVATGSRRSRQYFVRHTLLRRRLGAGRDRGGAVSRRVGSTVRPAATRQRRHVAPVRRWSRSSSRRLSPVPPRRSTGFPRSVLVLRRTVRCAIEHWPNGLGSVRPALMAGKHRGVAAEWAIGKSTSTLPRRGCAHPLRAVLRHGDAHLLCA
jgi:hypothetical protein